MSLIKGMEALIASLGISSHEVSENLGIKELGIYNDKLEAEQFTIDEVEKCFELILAKKQMIKIDKFDVVEYIEKVREEKNLQRKSLSDCLGITEAAYANRYTRKSFSLSDIIIMCGFLEIDLNDLKNRMLIKSDMLLETLDKISYRGIDNYYKNAAAMEKIIFILKNDVILSEVSPELLFEYGFWALDSAPNHNGYGIREAGSYFSKIVYNKEKVNLDFIAGVVYASLFSKIRSNVITIAPKMKSYEILNYLMQVYDSTEITYVLNKVNQKIDVGSEVKFFIPKETITPFLKEGRYSGEDEDGFNIILKYFLDLTNGDLDAQLVYEIKHILLKLQYAYNATNDEKIEVI